MRLTRRSFFRASAGSAAAATVIGALRSPSLAAAAVRATSGVTTLAKTFVMGEPGPNGYRPVIIGPGESRRRIHLGGTPSPGRQAARRRTPLLSFVQLSDVHIVDAQSPLRVEWTDRLDDPGTLPPTGLMASAYRPQEMLSGQVADAMVRRINAIAEGPVTGLPFALAIQTGDNSDNSQYNEVRWNIDLLSGGTVTVDSGDRTKWEGVADGNAATYDRAYWHPDGTPAGKTDDIPRASRGYPTVPGLLDAARRPFSAQGLNMPWYSVFGNHDGLVQGNFPAQTMQLNAIATGGAKIISPPLGLNPQEVFNQLTTNPVALLQDLLGLNTGVRTVTPDPDRRLLSRAQVVAEHSTTSGLPVGHGFTDENRANGTAYYSFTKGAIRFIVLDTVNPNGYADGSLDQPQFDWLVDRIKRTTDRYIVVCSHHTSSTMENPLVLTGGDPTPRVTGGDVVEVLRSHPKVIAWVNGHTHTNNVKAHARADGSGGFFEINTASHIDWPQQARIIEITDNGDRTLSIFTTMVDHAGPGSAAAGTANARELAGLSRELAGNDWHGGGHGSGTRSDRNMELVLPRPKLKSRSFNLQ